MRSAIGQPVLAITGHTFHDLIGMDYQQDVDLDKLSWMSPFSTSASWARHTPSMSSTWRCARLMARRGVAHICIPKDIQEWPVSDKMRSGANVKGHSGDWAHPSTASPPIHCCDRAAEIINEGSQGRHPRRSRRT